MLKIDKTYWLLGIFFTLILLCNYFIPLWADDYAYMYSYYDGKKIDSLYSVLLSQYKHWHVWGGRSTAHFIVQTMLYWGKDIFVVLNSIALLVLVLLVYFISKGEKFSKHISFFPLLIILFSIWFGIKVFGENIFWLTGAGNYLWTTDIALLLIYFFVMKYNQVNFNFGFWKMIGIFFLGVAAGWTNENTALTMIFILCCLNWFEYRRGKLEKWMIVSTLGAFIGFFFMIAAPGNYVRAQVIEDLGNTYNFVASLIHVLKTELKIMGANQSFLWVVSIYILLYFKKKQLLLVEKNGIMLGLLFIIASVICNLAMAASPIFPDRALMGSSIFLIIGTVILFNLYHKYKGFDVKGKSYKILATMMTVLLIGSMGLTIKYYYVLHNEDVQRMEIIKDAKSNGIIDVEVQPFSVKNGMVLKHVFVRDLEEEWVAGGLCRYFGLHSIKLK